MVDQPTTTPNTSSPTTPPPVSTGTPVTTSTTTNNSVFPSTYLGNNTSNYDIKSYLDNLTSLYNSYNTNYGNLSNAYTSALTPSAEETALTNDINNLNASERQGLVNTENKVIPMEFIVGQQAQIQKQASLDRLAKSESLQALTGQRLGRLDALKAQLGFEDNRFEKLLGLQKEFNDISKGQRDEARTTLTDIINYSQGKSFDELDPESQQAIINSTANSPLSLGLVKQGMERAKLAFQDEQAKNRAGMTDTVKLDNGQTILIDKSTGKIVSYLGGMKGDGTTTETKATTIKDQIDSIDNLFSNTKGLSAATGPTKLFSRGGNLNPAYRQDFVAGVEQLTSQLTLDNLIKAKAQGATFGALSEGELKILSGGATKINSWAIKDKNGNVTGYKTSEKNLKRELDKIRNFSKKDYILKGGNPTDVGAQTMSDGSIWSKNSDGTFTQIK